MSKRTKYRSVSTVVDGITFASRKEATRYSELRLLVRAGQVADLELQPEYPCRVNGVLVCTYKADFRYRDVASNTLVVEDVKGFRTRLYTIKKKLVQALYPITILET